MRALHINLLPHLLATVEQPLPLGLHFEELQDFKSQLVHFSEFGQVVDPVGLPSIHCTYLNPHCSCPLSNNQSITIMAVTADIMSNDSINGFDNTYPVFFILSLFFVFFK